MRAKTHATILSLRVMVIRRMDILAVLGAVVMMAVPRTLV
jgi:hypothetical protein